MKKLFSALLFILLCYHTKAQVVQVFDNYTVQQLIQNVLVGEGVEVSNITYSLAPNSYGWYIAPNGLMGADTGLVITTGTIFAVPGPNNASGAGNNNLYPGDFTLDQYTSGSTQDASVIEFDLKPQSDTIRFEFVFGSEEYNEYAGSNYNDVFAFVLTGPGLPANGKNLALLPNTNTPVTINNVNNNVNSQYYNDNTLFNAPAFNALQYDGYTKLMRAEHYPATPGATYHIKIAIADVWDGNFDSGVFLRGKSFSSPSVCDSMFNAIVITPVSCYGGENGSITIDSTTGGTGPYMYSLNGGTFITAAQFDSLMAGNYYLAVQDSNGCISGEGIVVAQPSRQLRFFTTFRKTYTCPDCATGQIVASGIGGVGPYQYSLDGENYQDSGVFQNLTPGHYTIYMRDAFGCVITRNIVLQ